MLNLQRCKSIKYDRTRGGERERKKGKEWRMRSIVKLIECQWERERDRARNNNNTIQPLKQTVFISTCFEIKHEQVYLSAPFFSKKTPINLSDQYWRDYFLTRFFLRSKLVDHPDKYTHMPVLRIMPCLPLSFPKIHISLSRRSRWGFPGLFLEVSLETVRVTRKSLTERRETLLTNAFARWHCLETSPIEFN